MSHLEYEMDSPPHAKPGYVTLSQADLLDTYGYGASRTRTYEKPKSQIESEIKPTLKRILEFESDNELRNKLIEDADYMKKLHENSTEQLSTEDLITIYNRLKNIFLRYTIQVTKNQSTENIKYHENLRKNIQYFKNKIFKKHPIDPTKEQSYRSWGRKISYTNLYEQLKGEKVIKKDGMHVDSPHFTPSDTRTHGAAMAVGQAALEAIFTGGLKRRKSKKSRKLRKSRKK